MWVFIGLTEIPTKGNFTCVHTRIWGSDGEGFALFSGASRGLRIIKRRRHMFTYLTRNSSEVSGSTCVTQYG